MATIRRQKGNSLQKYENPIKKLKIKGRKTQAF